MYHLCDANVWLALTLQHHDRHVTARQWLDGGVGAGSARFCRSTQHTLVRLLTTAAVFSPVGLLPLTNAQAWSAFDEIMTDGRIAMHADEPADLMIHWRRFSSRDSASPKLWMDAYLAAFAFTAGYRMVTTDHAFRQFPELDLEVLG